MDLVAEAGDISLQESLKQDLVKMLDFICQAGPERRTYAQHEGIALRNVVTLEIQSQLANLVVGEKALPTTSL